MPAIISRATAAIGRGFRAPETKSVGDDGYALALGGGWIPSSWGLNWWQKGYNPLPNGHSAVVESCISAYAQTVAMCPGTHWRLKSNGGRERVSGSALSRILKKPNSYQGISDFLLNLTHQLYQEGNAYAVGLRNNRFEFSEVHLMDARQSSPRVASTGEVFYSLGGNEVVESMVAASGADRNLLNYVPARDVLHIRLKRGRHPLIGVSPIVSAMLDEATSNAMARQALAFYQNQSRPSGVLATDEILTLNQANSLREIWNEQSQGLNAGGVPILTSGLKWQPMAGTARDAQLAEIMGYTDKRTAGVFRVPLPLINLTDGGAGPQGSTEALMQFWIATGFGFAVNHIEDAIGRFFGLSGLPDEYVEFDTAALLRSSFKERVEGWVAGTIGGVFAPNESRAEFELPEAEFGDEPRVQQQVVPLSAWAQTPPSTPGPPAPPPAPSAPPMPPQGDQANADGQREWATLILEAADRHERRAAA